MSPTARDVVAAYLETKAKSTKPAEQREHVATATREIAAELPDGFTYKDVRVCVGEYLGDEPANEGMTAQRIGRTVTKTLNDLVADGVLALDGGESYVHRGA